MSSSAHHTAEVPAFDVVDAVTPVGGAPCARCRGPIVDTYFEADERVICARCEQIVSSSANRPPTEGRFLRATAFGAIAAVTAAAAYVGVVALTGTELTVLALAVALLVGRAVRAGSAGHGGLRYQWLAAALTYLAIATTYVPFVLKGLGQGRLSITAAASLLLLAVAAPVLESATHLTGMVIIAASLFVAWRLNRRADVRVTGPFRVREEGVGSRR